MKFSEKYPNTKPGDVTDKDTLLVSDHEEPCVECGELTRFIDYCGESYLCSEECSYKHWTEISAACNAADESDDIPERGSIVLVEPGKPARIVTMELSLENLQKTVGGMIQAIYPWNDPVALICNDEGKLLGMPLNRTLTDEDGNVYDIVAGTFLICGLSTDNFAGLSEELAKLYSEKFRDAQTFVQRPDGSVAVIAHHVVEGK